MNFFKAFQLSNEAIPPPPPTHTPLPNDWVSTCLTRTTRLAPVQLTGSRGPLACFSLLAAWLLWHSLRERKERPDSNHTHHWGPDSLRLWGQARHLSGLGGLREDGVCPLPSVSFGEEKFPHVYSCPLTCFTESADTSREPNSNWVSLGFHFCLFNLPTGTANNSLDLG